MGRGQRTSGRLVVGIPLVYPTFPGDGIVLPPRISFCGVGRVNAWCYRVLLRILKAAVVVELAID